MSRDPQIDRIEGKLDKVIALLAQEPEDDFDIRIDPRDWKGESQIGKRHSQAPVEYLRVFAKMMDAFGATAEKTNKLNSKGQPSATFDRKQAKTAREWAKYRTIAGEAAPTKNETADDTDAPF